MNAIELRAVLYLLGALLSGACGAYLAGLHYKAVIAQGDAAVARTAAEAAMAAKAQQDVADANNRLIVARLQAQLDSAQSVGADFARKLRDAEARSSHLPQGTGGPIATAPSGQDGPDRLTELLAAAAGECLLNEARQDALIQELKPQL